MLDRETKQWTINTELYGMPIEGSYAYPKMIWQEETRSWRYELLHREYLRDCVKTRKRQAYEAEKLLEAQLKMHQKISEYVHEKWKSGQWLRLPDLPDGQQRD